MSAVPTSLKGPELEKALMDAAAREERNGILTMGRYGVDGVTVQGKIMLTPSKPDFEGVFATGRQFIIEAKCVAGPSFEMRKEKIKPRQISHMLTRSRFNVPCFLVIHFAARRLANANFPAFTVAIPVNDSQPRWQAFVDAAAKAKREKAKMETQPSITRDWAQDVGKLVPWVTPPRCKNALPDIVSFLWPELRQNPFLAASGECQSIPRPRSNEHALSESILTGLGQDEAAGGDHFPNSIDEWAL